MNGLLLLKSTAGNSHLANGFARPHPSWRIVTAEFSDISFRQVVIMARLVFRPTQHGNGTSGSYSSDQLGYKDTSMPQKQRHAIQGQNRRNLCWRDVVRGSTIWSFPFCHRRVVGGGGMNWLENLSCSIRRLRFGRVGAGNSPLFGSEAPSRHQETNVMHLDLLRRVSKRSCSIISSHCAIY